jgi:hypothetical protein
MRVKLALFVRTTLEAFVTLAPCGPHDLGEDNVGYSLKTLKSARWKLRKLKLVEKRGGFWWPTERGKIMLAVIMGQETRARGKRAERKLAERTVVVNRPVPKLWGLAKWRNVCNEHKPLFQFNPACAGEHERVK